MEKAYIVANEQQEREVLEKLEKEGMTWVIGRKPTEQMPSSSSFAEFPYVLFKRNKISWGFLGNLSDEKIVFDGRKEERMSEKYVVSQEFMNELEEWKEDYITDALDEKYHYVSAGDLDTLPGMIKDWWIELNKPTERNNRLITIIRWVNGEDVFEVEKWVVRSDSKDSEGDYWYVSLDGNEHNKSNVGYDIETATKFSTKEEAESWANAHQEVIEVVD